MNQIEKSQWINEDSLDQQQYFQSLFSEVCNKHLISATQIEKIQIEIVELLAKQVERFTNGDSSIQIEKAQQILQSTCYNMGVYLKSVADMDRKIEMLQNVKVSDIFYKGMEAVTSLVKSSKASLNILKAECLKIDNAAYRSTLFYGLPEFFHDYEYEFCAFDNPGSIDYPTCNPINNL
ncbi:MAG TPA: DUF6179 domain-containing protein, partial [Mobilitalea sp.]|nr:DUF6179 domain-containing protein [Mobilitalea sp.]